MTTLEILKEARSAHPALRWADTAKKNEALLAMADSLWEERGAILAANALDMDAARGHIAEVMLDRLALTEDRIAGMAEGVRLVTALSDPVGLVDLLIPRGGAGLDRKSVVEGKRVA